MAELNDRLDALQVVAERVREELARENVKRDRRIHTNRVLTGMVSVLAVIGIGVGTEAYSAGHDAKRALRNSIEQIHVSQKAACDQYNDQQDTIIAGDHRQASTLAKHLAPTPRSERVQKLIDDYLSDANRTSVDSHKHRDCTPRGIAKYLHITTTTTEGTP